MQWQINCVYIGIYGKRACSEVFLTVAEKKNTDNN